MNQHEILKEYLTALYRAEVVVSDNPSEPLYFNGADSLTDYRIHLLDVELPAIACLREIRRKEEEDTCWPSPCGKPSWNYKLSSGKRTDTPLTVT